MVTQQEQARHDSFFGLGSPMFRCCSTRLVDCTPAIQRGGGCSRDDRPEDTRVAELELGDTRFDYQQTYLTWFDAWLKNDSRAREG